MNWLVCQIGAREHYAIPRALERHGRLGSLITDFWIPPGHAFRAIPGSRRLRDRFHPDLVNAEVWAPNTRMLVFEAIQRQRRNAGGAVTMARNTAFQKLAIARLKREFPVRPDAPPMTLFSYSYAALELFRFAKARRWKTVLGQIDPGPEEERIVAEEHQRYPELGSRWAPVPPVYWQRWREELALADRIVVNSEWSKQCLLAEGADAARIQVVPLVYQGGGGSRGMEAVHELRTELKILFLGQINLRKGIGRLLDAMRLLEEEPVHLTLAGPSEIEERAWGDLPNVEWVGPLARSEVDAHYREADVFILPTLSDGYALTQLEAMSNGLPVIASTRCGAAVTEGVNGWILDDLEPATLRDLILRVGAARPRLKRIQPPAFSLDSLAEMLTTF